MKRKIKLRYIAALLIIIASVIATPYCVGL